MKQYFLFLIVPIFILLGGYCFVLFFLPLSPPLMPSSTVFQDKNREIIGEIIYSGSIRHQEIISEEIPDFYKKSLIALEDATFWTNNGVDIRWIVRSIIHDIQAGGIVEWGTTISSGLIRNILWINENRTVRKKILEFLYALRLNVIYSKDNILREYINRVNFGYMNYWLKSAAKYYFNQENPKNLTRAEQVALLILPKDPGKYNPYNKPKNFRVRFEGIVNALAKKGIITWEEQQNIVNEKLNWNRYHENTLPYIVDFFKAKPERYQIEPLVSTTFDSNLTEKIDTIAKNTLLELSWKNVSDYGILIAERGELNPLLRVMIGGENYHESTAGQVNTTLALRQPGSAIKPFTYTLAFEKLWFTPESTILDLPVAYKTSEDYSYEPKNYSQGYKGEITLRQALSESVNIPAIKLMEKVGVPTLLHFLRWLGITSLSKDAEYYGLGLTLGNGEISLFELLQAYTIFTNGGKYCPFKIIENMPIIPCTQQTDRIYTDMVVSILTDRYAKIGDFPLYSALDFGDRKVAVKTGTSRNFRDNWAVGFTDHYMIGVWTGNKSGEDMKWVTGATGAWEIFRRIVYVLEKNEQEQPPRKLPSQKQEYLTITNPLDGSLYKKEQEGNPDSKKIHLRFETNVPYDKAYWVLDGTKINTDFIDLIPWKHMIEIRIIKDGTITKKEQNTFQVEDIQ